MTWRGAAGSVVSGGGEDQPNSKLVLPKIPCRSTDRGESRNIRAGANEGIIPKRLASATAAELGAGTSRSMPLGIEARSHASQRRFGRQRQSGSPVPPHPSPSSPRRGCAVGRRARCLEASICRHAADSSPSPQRRGSHAGRATNLRVRPIGESRAWYLPLLWGEGGVRGNGAYALATGPGVLSRTPAKPGSNA